MPKLMKALKPCEKAYITYDEDLKGFGVRVNPSGSKTWNAEFRPYGGGGRVFLSRLALGRTNVLSAEEARNAA
jgi:Arm DNA-binding domain